MESLICQGILIRFSDKVIYHRDTVDQLQRVVTDYINKHQSITIRGLRDTLSFSRKYAQAILEYFDTAGLTKRVEDKHIIDSKTGG